MNNIAGTRLILLLCLTIFPLAGCAGVLNPGPPPLLYMLNPDLSGTAAATGQKLDIQLGVVQPSSNDILSTNRMVICFKNGEVRAWKGVSWVASAPNMLQRFLLEAYSNVDMLTAMSYDSLGYAADYRLLSYLEQFAVVLDEKNEPLYVQVQLNVHLVNLKTGKSLGALTSDSQVKVDGSDLKAVLAAFNTATSSSIKEVRDWSIKLLRSVK